MPNIRLMLSFICPATTEAGSDEAVISYSLVSKLGREDRTTPIPAGHSQTANGVAWSGTVNNADHRRYFTNIQIWEGEIQEGETAFLHLHFLEIDAADSQVAAKAAAETAAGAIVSRPRPVVRKSPI